MIKKQKKTIFHRAQFLKNLMEDAQQRLVVAGTHGKTTSTGMLISIFHKANKTPSFAIGGELNPLFVNGAYTEDSTFIAEVDESDGSFLLFDPNYAIITNVESEHMSYFQSKERLFNHFSNFMIKKLLGFNL